MSTGVVYAETKLASRKRKRQELFEKRHVQLEKSRKRRKAQAEKRAVKSKKYLSVSTDAILSDQHDFSFSIKRSLCGRRQEDAFVHGVQLLLEKLGLECVNIFRTHECAMVAFFSDKTRERIVQLRLSFGNTPLRRISPPSTLLLEQKTSGILAFLPRDNQKSDSEYVIYDRFALRDLQFILSALNKIPPWQITSSSEHQWKSLSYLQSSLQSFIQKGESCCPTIKQESLKKVKSPLNMTKEIVEFWEKSKKDSLAVGQTGEFAVATWLRESGFEVIYGHEVGAIDLACRHSSWESNRWFPIQVKTARRAHFQDRGALIAEFMNLAGSSAFFVILLILDSNPGAEPQLDSGRTMVYATPGSTFTTSHFILSLRSEFAYESQICGSHYVTDIKNIILNAKDGVSDKQKISLVSSEEVKKAPDGLSALEATRIAVLKTQLQNFKIELTIPNRGQQKFDFTLNMQGINRNIKVQLKGASFCRGNLTDPNAQVQVAVKSSSSAIRALPAAIDIKDDFDYLFAQIPADKSADSNNSWKWFIVSKDDLFSHGILSNGTNGQGITSLLFPLFKNSHTVKKKHYWAADHVYDFKRTDDISRLKTEMSSLINKSKN